MCMNMILNEKVIDLSTWRLPGNWGHVPCITEEHQGFWISVHLLGHCETWPTPLHHDYHKAISQVAQLMHDLETVIYGHASECVNYTTMDVKCNAYDKVIGHWEAECCGVSLLQKTRKSPKARWQQRKKITDCIDVDDNCVMTTDEVSLHIITITSDGEDCQCG